MIEALRYRLLSEIVYSTVGRYLDEYKIIQTLATNPRSASFSGTNLSMARSCSQRYMVLNPGTCNLGNRQHEQTGSYIYMSQRRERPRKIDGHVIVEHEKHPTPYFRRYAASMLGRVEHSTTRRSSKQKPLSRVIYIDDPPSCSARKCDDRKCLPDVA